MKEEIIDIHLHNWIVVTCLLETVGNFSMPDDTSQKVFYLSEIGWASLCTESLDPAVYWFISGFSFGLILYPNILVTNA